MGAEMQETFVRAHAIGGVEADGGFVEMVEAVTRQRHLTRHAQGALREEIRGRLERRRVGVEHGGALYCAVKPNLYPY